MNEIPVPLQPCFTCQSIGHQGVHCPISPSIRDLMAEHANVVGQNWPPIDAQYGNTYNPNWKNQPTSPGSLNLQHMFPQVHSGSNNMGPPLSNSSHQPHPMLSKLS